MLLTGVSNFTDSSKRDPIVRWRRQFLRLFRDLLAIPLVLGGTSSTYDHDGRHRQEGRCLALDGFVGAQQSAERAADQRRDPSTGAGCGPGDGLPAERVGACGRERKKLCAGISENESRRAGIVYPGRSAEGGCRGRLSAQGTDTG